jgi:flagellar biosynthesis protein FlhG
MRSLSDLDHYELLDVARDAAPDEIERAYRMAAATYEAGSLATYSLYSEAESAAMRERLEHAYAVLSDAETRAAYDGTLANGNGHAVELDAVPLDLTFEEPPRGEIPAGGLDFLESPDEDGVPYDGARLRRNRLQRGIDIEQIARVTKVNPTYLRFIEEDKYETLPAAVYVRGFVTAYARCLGLDSARVVTDYMERFEAGRPPPVVSRVGEAARSAVRRGRPRR